MKKFTGLLFGMLGVVMTGHAQTLRIANNNPAPPTGVNVYTGTTALQDAITASAPGDIIYVVPSTASYGDIIIDTARTNLTIFGIGIRPQRDLSVLSKIGLVTIEASGVRISGIGEMGTLRLASSNNPTPSNILIENNRLLDGIRAYSISGSTIGNLIVRNNIFVSSIFFVLYDYTPNAIITNNVFIGGAGIIGGLTCTNVSLSYNIFANTGDADIFDRVEGCLFEHNIFYGVRVDITNVDNPSFGSGNTWNYNLAYGNSVATYNVFEVALKGNTGVGNLESTGPGNLDPLFVNFPFTTVWDQSYDFSLQAGSPAIGAGQSGQTIGPSGGDPAFDFDGNLLPFVQSITLPAVIPVGNDLPVNIKAKGN